MQVANAENFIFGMSNMNFGGLYKSTQAERRFLNTFTSCILQETALQF